MPSCSFKISCFLRSKPPFWLNHLLPSSIILLKNSVYILSRNRSRKTQRVEIECQTSICLYTPEMSSFPIHLSHVSRAALVRLGLLTSDPHMLIQQIISLKLFPGNPSVSMALLSPPPDFPSSRALCSRSCCYSVHSSMSLSRARFYEPEQPIKQPLKKSIVPV